MSKQHISDAILDRGVEELTKRIQAYAMPDNNRELVRAIYNAIANALEDHKSKQICQPPWHTMDCYLGKDVFCPEFDAIHNGANASASKALQESYDAAQESARDATRD